MEAAPSAFVARLHVPGLNATRLLHRPKVAPEPSIPPLGDAVGGGEEFTSNSRTSERYGFDRRTRIRKA